MKIGLILIAVVIGCLANSMTASAQDSRIFGGRGIREESPSAESKSRWPKLLNFSKEAPSQKSTINYPFSSNTVKAAERYSEPESRPGFSFPKFEKPSFEFLKRRPSLFENEMGQKPFSGMSSLFPKRELGEPNVFEKMNSKSKDIIDRTTNWAQQKNQNLRDKTFDTWDAITRGGLGQGDAGSQAIVPSQPPVRAAQSAESARVRF
ncbi:MAG: hypothetical protein ACI87E_000083 [Mariniblastus sp.]|jgi:hypothetical protein